MPYTFEGAFRMLNRPAYKNDVGKRADCIAGWLPEMLSIETLNQSIFWLVSDVNQSAPAITAVYRTMLEFVQDNREVIVKFGNSNVANKGPLARFLIEVLRCCNFATHNSGTIEYFRMLFADINVVVTGQPQQCQDNATFANLDFNDAGQVVMEIEAVRR